MFFRPASRAIYFSFRSRRLSLAYSISTQSDISSNHVLRTKPVPRVVPSSVGNLDLSVQTEPFIVSSVPIAHGTFETSSNPTQKGTVMERGSELLRALRAAPGRLVELELGRYDAGSSGAFDRIEMPLGHYVDWLERNDSGRVEGKQVYLAQWRGAEEVPELSRLVRPPPVLRRLMESEEVDVYQTSFFIGPTGAVTPIHHDPYENLYHLQASSTPRTHAKHFVLFPPSMSKHLISPRSVQRNTSSLELQLIPYAHNLPEPAEPADDVHLPSPSYTPSLSLKKTAETEPDPFSILVPLSTVTTATVPSSSTIGVLSTCALSCILHEGETLYIPRRWWHRVENIVLPGSAPMMTAGWTAGVGWWFLPRSS